MLEITFAEATEIPVAELAVGDFVETIPTQHGVRGTRVNSGVTSIERVDGVWGVSHGRGRPRTPVESIRLTFLVGASVTVPAAFSTVTRRRTS